LWFTRKCREGFPFESRGRILNFRPIKVMDIELSRPLPTIEGLNGYGAIQALIRLHGTPVGYVRLPVLGDCCSAEAFEEAILEEHSWAILRRFLYDGLTTMATCGRLRMEDLIHSVHPEVRIGPRPLVTVAVCSRDRTADLALCLDSLQGLSYPFLDLLVVDNAPSSNATEILVREKYPHMRYIREERPGLNWARNRAIVEARGEIIAYTDDDVVVDPGWITALVNIFAENPEVMAVTGLVVPDELETEAQILFEKKWGGFGKGFERKWYRADGNRRVGKVYGSPGKLGSGANMAFRVGVFGRIGYFDPALDAGTPADGGGDLEMFFRFLKEGYTLVYEPRAIVRHRHRRDFADLQRQLTTWGTGFYSHLLRSAFAYPEERLTLFWLGTEQFMRRNIRYGLVSSLRELSPVVRDLLCAELWGALKAPFRYRKSRSVAVKIEQTFGPLLPAPEPTISSRLIPRKRKSTAVRTVDLCQLSPLTDVADFTHVRLCVYRKDHFLGNLDIPTYGPSISRSRLCDAIVDHLGVKLLDSTPLSPDLLQRKMFRVLAGSYIQTVRAKGNVVAS